MTDAEKITMVQTLLDNDAEATNAVVSVYLTLAKDKVLHRLYPLGATREMYSVPVEYEVLQCELARNLFLKRGAEGETAHSENGVSRSYQSANDEDILGRIVPYGKVV